MPEKSVRKQMNECIKGNKINLNNLDYSVNEGTIQRIQEINSHFERIKKLKMVYPLLQKIKAYDENIYYHSLDVGMRVIKMEVLDRVSEQTIEYLATAAMLLDVGCIELPNELFTKKKEITKEEYSQIKEHVFHSERILRESGFSETIIEYVKKHHERSNGSGYPMKLTRTDISPETYDIIVADVYEAMVEDRPYRKRKRFRETIEHIQMVQKEEYHPYSVQKLIKSLQLYY